MSDQIKRPLGTVEDVAKFTGFAPGIVYKKPELFPGLVRIGRSIRFDMDVLETTLRARAQSNQGGAS